MTDLERVIKTIDLLIFNDIVKNKRELAEKLGYTESSISQIVNGKVPLSNRFLKKLSILATDRNNNLLSNSLNVHENESKIFEENKYIEKNNDLDDINDLDKKSRLDKNYRLVALYSNDVVVSNSNEDINVNGNVIGYMPFVNAKQNDICIPITNDSMHPFLSSGTIILIRELEYWREYIEYGQVHMIELKDERRIIKTIKAGRDDLHIKLISSNESYDDSEISKDFIKTIWLVISKYQKVVM